MSALAWVIVGVLGEAVFTSLASMWHVEYVFPQWFLVVMMFVAVNRELFSALGVAVLLGVVVGRFALAPWGLYELSLIVTSVIVFRFSATLSGRGAIFFWCAVYRRKYRVSNRDIVFVELSARPCWVCKPRDSRTFSDRFRDGTCCCFEPWSFR